MKSKQTNQICSPLKIRQSTLNKAHLIEIAKTCTVALKARNFLVLRCREEKRVSIEKQNKTKKKEYGENSFFKASGNRFWLTSKSCYDRYILVNIKMLFMVHQSWSWPTFYQMDLIRLDVQIVQKIPSEMVIGQQIKVKKNDQNYSWFLLLTFQSFASYAGCVNNML